MSLSLRWHMDNFSCFLSAKVQKFLEIMLFFSKKFVCSEISYYLCNKILKTTTSYIINTT